MKNNLSEAILSLTKAEAKNGEKKKKKTTFFFSVHYPLMSAVGLGLLLFSW